MSCGGLLYGIGFDAASRNKEQRIMIMGMQTVFQMVRSVVRSQTNFVMDLGTYHWLSTVNARGHKSATNG
ncbi:MAG: hypothetical protein ACLU4N_25885 [Butyricimonas faecihominis]